MPAAVVTGSSRGIGRGVALRYARDGFDVVVNYHSNEAAATEVVEAIRETTDRDAVAVGADVADPDAASALVEAAVERFGSLHHVVTNAGINEHVYPEDLTAEGFDHVMGTNVTGTYAVCRAALPHLRAAAADGAAPSVVTVSSRLAFTGADYEPHYAASKAAVVALTKSLALAFAPEVRVNCVAPGYVETDMTDATNDAEDKRERRDAIPVGRLGTPDDVAEAAAYLRDAGYVTGETVQVNGGQFMR
ncbi:SDR family NAD(P)-dependent oxidoreductase [Halomarina litorea]|uniref:SDR family NAD(P)-dependent oxidoreductase n=1 Tax=Halomarina litorea TaxID=2961595 RepID=UPI0020C2DDED|nr:SDR family NAD(P)-dependent oxidoreductase [Halomarina sp. BCD28]